MTNHNDVHRAVQDIITHVNETVKKIVVSRWNFGNLPLDKPSLELLVDDLNKEITKASQESFTVYHRVFDSFVESNITKKSARPR